MTNQEYYEKHKEYLKQRARENYAANAESRREQKREYTKRLNEADPDILRKRYADADDKRRATHNAQRRERYQRDRELIRKQQAECRERHREEFNRRERERTKAKREADPIYRLKRQVRGMVRDSFTRFSYQKNARVEEILGMPAELFCKYLLETYRLTYGYEWDLEKPVHIDHIIPLASATTEAEVYALCNYKNLRLIKAEDNLRKGTKQDYKIEGDMYGNH